MIGMGPPPAHFKLSVPVLAFKVGEEIQPEIKSLLKVIDLYDVITLGDPDPSIFGNRRIPQWPDVCILVSGKESATFRYWMERSFIRDRAYNIMVFVDGEDYYWRWHQTFHEVLRADEKDRFIAVVARFDQLIREADEAQKESSRRAYGKQERVES